MKTVAKLLAVRLAEAARYLLTIAFNSLSTGSGVGLAYVHLCGQCNSHTDLQQGESLAHTPMTSLKNFLRSQLSVWLIAFTAIIPALPLNTCAGADTPEYQSPTRVEHALTKPRFKAGGLGTRQYRPSNMEQPYFERLNEKERVTGGLASDYRLSGKQGQYVGWFGVVRKVASVVHLNVAGERLDQVFQQLRTVPVLGVDHQVLRIRQRFAWPGSGYGQRMMGD